MKSWSLQLRWHLSEADHEVYRAVDDSDYWGWRVEAGALILTHWVGQCWEKEVVCYAPGVWMRIYSLDEGKAA